jgi:hypothetical protein
MEQVIFERLCIIDIRYKKMGLDHLTELVKTGKALIDHHGIDDLQYKLKTLEEFKAAGAYFDFNVATNEELYERKRK